MAVAYRSLYAEPSGSNANSRTLTEPTGTAENDILIAVIYIEGNPTVTPPAGWNNDFAGTAMLDVVADHSSRLYWIRRGASAPGLAWTWSGNIYSQGAVVAYSGAKLTGDPFSFGNAEIRNDTTSTAWPPVSGTTLTPNEMLVWIGVQFNGGSSSVPPTGFTERIEISGDDIAWADVIQASAGSTGSITGAQWTGSPNGTATAMLASLQPDTGGVTTVSRSGSITGTSSLSAAFPSRRPLHGFPHVGRRVIRSRATKLGRKANIASAFLATVIVPGAGSAPATVSRTGSISGTGTLTANRTVLSPPGAPTVVRPSDAFGYSNTVSLSWTAASGTVTDYEVEYSSNDGSSWTAYATGTSTTTSQSVTGLTNGVRYLFRVRAMNSTVAGPWATSEWGCTPHASSAPETLPTGVTQASADWALARIDKRSIGTQNFRRARTGAGVRIYHVDSGIRSTHNEFTGNTGTEVSAHTVTAAGGGSAFVTVSSHGTWTASKAVGATLGVAPGADLYVIKAWVDDAWSTSDPESALQWIIDNHPPGVPAVVTNSTVFSESENNNQPSVLNGLVNTIVDTLGLLYVQCTGNTFSEPIDPLAARTGVIHVGATASDDAVSSFNIFDPRVDIFAPGTQVLCASNSSNSATELVDGTSFGTPLVAGAVATWLEAHPTLTPAQLQDILFANSTKGAITGSLSGQPNRLLYTLAALPVPGSVTVSRTGSLSGTGTLSATGNKIKFRTGSITGTSTLAATALHISPRTATLTGTGNLSATGIVISDIGDIPNMLAWYDASDTASTTVSGGFVTTLAPQDGYGPTLTGASNTGTVGSRNGLATIVNTNNGYSGALSGSVTTTNSMHVFFVGLYNSGIAETYGRIWSFGVAGVIDWQNPNGFTFSKENSKIPGFYRDGTGAIEADADYDDAWHVFELKINNGAVTLLVDGTLVGSGSTSTSNFNFDRIGLMGSQNADSERWRGPFGEAATFTRALGTGEATYVRDYLHDKWVVDGASTVSRTGSVTGTGILSATGAVVKLRTSSLSGSGTLVSSGVRVVSRTATVTGTGTFSAVAVRVKLRTASLAGTGTLAGTGLHVSPRTGSIAGTSTLVATGHTTHSRTASLSGTGTLTATKLRIVVRTSSLTGTGTLAATKLRIAIKTAALSGTGALSATSSKTAIRTATLSGTGTLTASYSTNGSVARTGSVSGTGTLAATKLRIAVETATLSGTSTLAATKLRISLKTGSVAGTGTLAATGVRVVQRTASLSGTGTLSAVAARLRTASGTVTGTGTLNATGQEILLRTASLSGTGTLTATWVRVKVRTASLSGTGTLSSTAVPVKFSSGSLSGTSNLVGVSRKVAVRTATMSGTSTLNANKVRIVTRTASLSGNGVLSTTGTVAGQYSGIVSGTGLLTGTGFKIVSRTASLSGASTLSAVKLRIVARTATMAGSGTFTAVKVRVVTRTASVSGSGVVTASGLHLSPRSGTINGTATLAAAGFKIVRRTASISATGHLAASYTGVIISRSATISGVGVVTGVGVRVVARTGSMAGASTLLADRTRVVVKSGVLSGISSMAAAFVLGPTASGAIIGVGSLSATSMRIVFASGTIFGTGALVATTPVRIEFNELKAIGQALLTVDQFKIIGAATDPALGHLNTVSSGIIDRAGNRFSSIGRNEKIGT